MTKKEQREKKIKDILKKVLNVFCYVVTALAIVLGIAVGVTKCSGSNEPQRIDLQQADTSNVVRNNLINPDYNKYYVYENRYPAGTYSIDLDSVRSYFNVSNLLSPYQRSAEYRNLYFSDPAYVLSDYNNSDIFVPVTRIRFEFMDCLINSSTNQYEYKLRYVEYVSGSPITSGGDNTAYLLVKSSQYAEDDVYVSYPVRIVLSDSDLDEHEGFMYVLAPAVNQDFTFNASFNYNAPFGLPCNAVYGTPDTNDWFDGGGDALSYKLYNVGWFLSNGRLFNQIQWWAIKGNGVSVVIDGNISTLQYSGNYVYTFMYYRNSLDPEPDLSAVLVNARDSIPYNGGNSRYYANSSTWLVPAYRNITFLNTPTAEISDLLGSFNNNNQYDTGSLSVGGGFGDVFTLVGSAFTGLLPILTLQLFPSVTIGTLLFVPLVAMLVFAIIRVIKK